MNLPDSGMHQAMQKEQGEEVERAERERIARAARPSWLRRVATRLRGDRAPTP